MPADLDGLPLTRAAIAYAQRAHDGQRRLADGAPFIAHPLEVGALLYHAGASDHLIAAGVLHDTIEKTDVDASDLRERFGNRVAALVLAVSEDQDITGYTRRKAALREQVAGAGEEALTLFAADKLSKAREFHLATGSAPNQHSRDVALTRADARRLKHYRGCLRLLSEQLPDCPLVEELRTELDASRKGNLGSTGSAPAIVLNFDVPSHPRQRAVEMDSIAR